MSKQEIHHKYGVSLRLLNDDEDHVVQDIQSGRVYVYKRGKRKDAFVIKFPEVVECLPVDFELSETCF